MDVRVRKFSVNIKTCIPPNACDVFRQISEKYEFLEYISIYTDDEKMYIYLYFKNKVVQSKLYKILVNMGFKIKNITNPKTIIGEILSEHGEMKKMGPKKRKVSSPQTINNITNNTQNIHNGDNNTNNNVNIVFVNPIGQESLDHITPEYIQDLLSQRNGPDVVFRFGRRMYSVKENMNFKTDVKSGYISGRSEVDGAWVTLRKNEGFHMLMDNLKNKNEEAVRKCMEDIPPEDFEQFKADMHWIHEHKTSGLMEDVPVYNGFVRDGFNLMVANLADKARRIERDMGKKMRLL